jgi:hypothetical protein
MAFKGKIPEKGSAQWKRNESVIARNPALRRAREVSEGFSGNSTATTGSRVGGASEAYKDGWDRIFGNKKEDDQT